MATQNKIYIYGKHAVREALMHAPRVLRKIMVSQKLDDKSLRELIKRSGIPTEPLDERQATSQAPGGAAHQGVIALVSLAELTKRFDEFFANFAPGRGTVLVLLDELTDPHNVGAIIRSAGAFGAAAVLMPVQKQSPITGAVIKASAGVAFTLPLVLVDNLQQAISKLKKSGVCVYALAGDAKKSIAGEEFADPALFVLGNEAQGIAPAVRTLCDEVLAIPLSAQAESLNVAASAAVALYAWSLKHPHKN